MARFEFSIQINGTGENATQAWLDAIRGFEQESGLVPDVYETFCEECGESIPIEDLIDGRLCGKCHDAT